MGTGNAIARVSIKRADAKRRLVFGEVYAPNRLDTHGEAMAAEDIEIMAHRFLHLVDPNKAIDTQHDNKPNGSYPVESFIARDGDPDFTPGAWVLGVKVPDDAVWAKIESGEIAGFSFEARVEAHKEVVQIEMVRDLVGATEAAEDGHRHVYCVEIGADGNVTRGRTSAGPDGHVHEIVVAGTTEVANGHAHRFFYFG